MFLGKASLEGIRTCIQNELEGLPLEDRPFIDPGRLLGLVMINLKLPLKAETMEQ